MANSNKDTLKVLVVVDVQNCFIAGGSFGGHETNIDFDKLKRSYDQIQQIEKLIHINKKIIFTRDYHPINHLSLAIPGKVKRNLVTTYRSHCLNTVSKPCERKNGLNNDNIKKIRAREYITIEQYINFLYKNSNYDFINKIYQKVKGDKDYIFRETKIIGTNLSWLYCITRYEESIFKLIKKESAIGIKIEDTKNTEPNYKKISKCNEEEPEINLNYKRKNYFTGRTFIQLTKGQLCSYESYSAFNYHLRLEKAKIINEEGKKTLSRYVSEYITPEYEKKNKLKDLSTGLFEYILDTNEEKIEITVCGLVGEICIINSIIEGLIMWNLYYKEQNKQKKVTFIYSLYGTLFTGLDLGFGDKYKPEPTFFFNNMRTYLDNKVYPEYKKYIRFNVLGYNGTLIGRFYYSETKRKFIAKKINNNKNNNKNNKNNNNNKNNFKSFLEYFK